MNYNGLTRKNLFVAESLESIEDAMPENKRIERDIIRLKKKKGTGWKQLYHRLSYEPLKRIIIKEIFNGIEPTFEQHFSKKFWKYPSSLSFRNKYSDDVQDRVIETFREMSVEDIENGNHRNISLCSNLRPGGKKLFKWKEPRVRIIYGTIKHSRYLNVVFFDSSDIKTTSKHASQKDKNDIRKFQTILEQMERKIHEQEVRFEDSADVSIERIGIDDLFESVGFMKIDDFDEEFVRSIASKLNG